VTSVQRTAFCDVTLHVYERQRRRAAVAFTPHVFIQVVWHKLRPGANHPLEPSLDGAPVCLDMVGAYTRNWVREIPAMVHRLMNITECHQLGICTPFIGPHCGAWSDDALDDRQQRSGLTPMYELNIAMTLLRIVHTEVPSLRAVTSMVILCSHHHRLINLHHLANAAQYNWCLQ